MMLRWTVVLLVALVGSCVAGCGDDASYDVTTAVVSEPEVEDLHVWAPDSEGSFPIVYVVPGSGGEAERDLRVVASELASRGVVVLATDWTTKPRLSRDAAMKDAECGYRFARTVAEDYGGDLSEPVTIAGYSLGALAVVYQGIGEEEFDEDWRLRSGDPVPCFEAVDRPDIVIGIAGPYTDFGFPSEVQAWGNQDGSFTLITGEDDTNCPTRQSEMVLNYLQQKGYEATLVEIPETDHGELVFHDLDDDWAELPPDSQGGQQTVQTILDAIEAKRT